MIKTQQQYVTRKENYLSLMSLVSLLRLKSCIVYSRDFMTKLHHRIFPYSVSILPSPSSLHTCHIRRYMIHIWLQHYTVSCWTARDGLSHPSTYLFPCRMPNPQHTAWDAVDTPQIFLNSKTISKKCIICLREGLFIFLSADSLSHLFRKFGCKYLRKKKKQNRSVVTALTFP